MTQIQLRSFREEDFPLYFAHQRDPDVVRHLGGYDDESVARRLFNGFNERGILAIVDRESDSFVGTCGLRQAPTDDKDFELSVGVVKNLRCSGIALAACKEMLERADALPEGSRVIARIKPDNEASKVLAAKLGFKFREVYRGPFGSGEEELWVL